MKLLLTLAICLAAMCGFAQQKAIITDLSFHATGDWYGPECQKKSDTLIITDLAKIHFIKVGNTIYQIVVPEPEIQQVSPAMLLRGSAQFFGKTTITPTMRPIVLADPSTYQVYLQPIKSNL